MFVVLVILGSVSSKHEVKLDKRYKLPKMRYKGPGPLPQTVRAERPALISEVRMCLLSCPSAWAPWGCSHIVACSTGLLKLVSSTSSSSSSVM